MNIVFFKTSSCSRSGIHRNFQILNLNDFKRELNNGYMHCESYAMIDRIKSTNNIRMKKMDLKTFEDFLTPNEYTPEQITRWFGRHISDVYGEHAIKKQIQRIPKRYLRFGHIYKTETNNSYVGYLGKVKMTKKYPQTNDRPQQIVESEGYLLPRYYEYSSPKDRSIHYYDEFKLNKSIPKLIEDTGFKVTGINRNILNLGIINGVEVEIEFQDYLTE